MPLIDRGTKALAESCASRPLDQTRAEANRDELTPIARYIAQEMNANSHGDDAKRMKELNAFSAEACIADFTRLPMWKQILGLGVTPEQCIDSHLSYRGAALMAWGLKVRQNGDWDHKPRIARRFNDRNPGGLQHWHLHGCTLYFYDVWSNLHYGYVGRAAGFTESVLLDGAGVEQIGSDLVRLKIPERSPVIAGMRAWDAASDRAAIEAGVRLFGTRPGSVTAQEVLAIVLGASFVQSKPYAP